jgi:hypothetical protein
MILPGNAMDVFHVVSQLARKSSKDTITEERMLKAPNWITIVD